MAERAGVLSNCIVFKVADIVFALSDDKHFPPLEQSYKDFLCAGIPEVTVHACSEDAPQVLLQDKDKVFDSETIWSLYRVGEQYIFTLTYPLDLSPYRTAIFDINFMHGKVYSRVTDSGVTKDLINPLEYPLSEVLTVCLLSQGRGLMVHACGIDDKGQGYLFAGNSTHGKSTMARLWKDQALVLNDDRIILRRRNGRFWMYGTPWHGDYNGVSPQGVPLSKIFFLRHAETNCARRKEKLAASSMLLTRCFPPLWDDAGMRFTLDFCAELVDEVPCYELDFLPDTNIVDFVRCVK